MYAALAAILLALAALSVAALGRPGQQSAGAGSPTEVDATRGFLLVGAVALVGWTVVVIVVGLLDDRSARAEGLAMLGLFTYVVYVLGACLLRALALHRSSRR